VQGNSVKVIAISRIRNVSFSIYFINSVLRLLHIVNLGTIAFISEVQAATIFTFEVNHRVIII
jgi:hypothetical protein